MTLPHPDEVEWSAAPVTHTLRRNLRQAYDLVYRQAQGDKEEVVSYRDLALIIHRSESTARKYVALWEGLGLCLLKSMGAPGLPGKAAPAKILFGSEQDAPDATHPTTAERAAGPAAPDHCLRITQKHLPTYYSVSAFSRYLLKNNSPTGETEYLCGFETLEGFARATLTYDPDEPRWEELGHAAHAIADMAWVRGGNLPSIRQTAETVGWSHAQVHRAMGSLADYGYDVERAPRGWSINVPFQLEGAELDDWMDLVEEVQKSWSPTDLAFLLDRLPVETTTHDFDSLRQQRIRADIARHRQTTESLWALAKHSIEVLAYVAEVSGDQVDAPSPSAVVRAVLADDQTNDRLAPYVSLVDKATRGASISRPLRRPEAANDAEGPEGARSAEEDEQNRIENLRERVKGGSAQRGQAAS